MTITYSDGVAIANLLEPLASAVGYHIALGGSVLHKGFSDKDLDIIVYLHTKFKKKPQIVVSPEDFIKNLAPMGFQRDHNYIKGSGADETYKEVIVTELNGKRVDFIFLLPS